MKKYIISLYFLLLIVSPNMLAQVYYPWNRSKNIPDSVLNNIDKMGIDDNLLLTELEGEYFNALYQVPDKEFNLSGKKVAFFTGSLGKTESNKVEYFIIEKNRLKCNYSPSPGTLYIFNATQKAESGGYDAAIVYWSKTVFTIEDVVKRLKEKH